MAKKAVKGLEKFKALYQFEPRYTLKVGVERECHLIDKNSGRIAPLAPKVYPYLKAQTNGRGICFGYELSACQLEDRTEYPCEIEDVKDLLFLNERDIVNAERELNFSRIFIPSTPDNVPLDIYPDERYVRITKNLPNAVIRAACRVAGVHVHVGMPDHETALKVYNKVIRDFKQLCWMGATENRMMEYCRAAVGMSERMDLFQKHLMTRFVPPPYKDWAEFYQRAQKEKFEDDPRRLWDFIRISSHGTIEFRMFDTTEDIDTIVSWARVCYGLCLQAF